MKLIRYAIFDSGFFFCLMFAATVLGVDVDVCVNNQLALENTRLLRRYADIDPRVRPLLFIIKRWAKQRGCNDPKNSTITSYAWVLLALHYLQSACRPPVVPDLADPGSATVAEAWSSSNSASVGELLYGFFVYYGSGKWNGTCYLYLSDMILVIL